MPGAVDASIARCGLTAVSAAAEPADVPLDDDNAPNEPLFPHPAAFNGGSAWSFCWLIVELALSTDIWRSTPATSGSEPSKTKFLSFCPAVVLFLAFLPPFLPRTFIGSGRSYERQRQKRRQKQGSREAKKQRDIMLACRAR
jgi:hypothetical protein